MLPLLPLALHLLCQGVSAQWSRTPSTCTDASECLSYITVCRDSEYETRDSEPSLWVGTHVLHTEGRYRAKARLTEYFNKKNRPGIQIERTAPILTLYTSLNGDPRPMAVFFLLPRRFLLNPPLPRDELVYLSHAPGQVLFVRPAGALLFRLERKAQELFEDLLRQRESFLRDRFYVAEYSSPLRLFGRRNEIWYQALGAPLCAARYGRTL
ncbi:heme-binding protein 1-like [Narcine bancroftii]|uniref:heme-binding protein 1-like n=1 Tax=Narcine bancroftii TaxID=1343680 RepID=UPI0038320785